MGSILDVIVKVLEYFYDPKRKNEKKISNLCRNVVTLHHLSTDFQNGIKVLANLLKNELLPILKEVKEVDSSSRSVDGNSSKLENNFSQNQLDVLISSIENFHWLNRPTVFAIAKEYNSLNKIRDQILTHIAVTIPLSKLGIMFPELKNEVLDIILWDFAGQSTVNINFNEAEKILKSLDENNMEYFDSIKVPLQLDFLLSLNEGNEQRNILSYIKNLENIILKLDKMLEELSRFIRGNCSLSEIL